MQREKYPRFQSFKGIAIGIPCLKYNQAKRTVLRARCTRGLPTSGKFEGSVTAQQALVLYVETEKRTLVVSQDA